MIDREDTIEVLNGLIENCRDGEFGFRECAAYVESPALQRLFWARSEECRAAAEELQVLVTGCNAVPADSGTTAGAIHRGWISLKAVLRPNNDQGMLEECERGEDVALDRYRRALARDLPEGVRKVLERQLQGVKRNHDQIRALREAQEML